MISLSEDLYKSIEGEYVKKISKKIKNKYNSKKKRIGATLGKGTNLISTFSLLEEKGVYSEAKVKRLLTSKITPKDLTDDDFKNYLKTVMFIENSHYDISEKIKLYSKDMTIEKYNKMYYQTYKNPIINSYLNKNEKLDFSRKELSIDELCNRINKDLEIFNKQIKECLINCSFIDDKMRHKILTDTGIDVCPYCNRQYITKYVRINEEKERTTADLDHFYPKSKFSLFALSLYNFIPSCQVCNSRFKLDHSELILYPFKEEYGKCIRFVNKNDNTYNTPVDLSLNYYKDKIDTIGEEKYFKDLEIFNIEEIYKSHEKMLQNIRDRYAKCSSEAYKKYFEDSILDKQTLRDSEWNALILGFYLDEEKDKNKPFGKAVNDLLKQQE